MRHSSRPILSPGRTDGGGRDLRSTPTPTLTTSLSRRLRHNNSLRGGAQSPALFPSTKKSKGSSSSSFPENPEPSSPKVTCIGQVRVKTKKQGKKIKMRACGSKRVSGDGSFRRVHRRSFSEPALSTPTDSGGRNQKWVHLPFSICETLRDFNCLIPCKASCLSTTTNNENDNNNCGVLRWLVSMQEGEGEGGKRKDIELIVGGNDEEDEKGKESRGCSYRRRSIFDDMEFDDLFRNDSDKSNVDVVESGKSSVPPKNALLLMRCRSDPVRVASLSRKFQEVLLHDVDDGEEVVDEVRGGLEGEGRRGVENKEEIGEERKSVEKEEEMVIESRNEGVMEVMVEEKVGVSGKVEDLGENSEIVEVVMKRVEEIMLMEGENIVNECSFEAITVENAENECSDEVITVESVGNENGCSIEAITLENGSNECSIEGITVVSVGNEDECSIEAFSVENASNECSIEGITDESVGNENGCSIEAITVENVANDEIITLESVVNEECSVEAIAGENLANQCLVEAIAVENLVNECLGEAIAAENAAKECSLVEAISVGNENVVNEWLVEAITLEESVEKQENEENSKVTSDSSDSYLSSEEISKEIEKDEVEIEKEEEESRKSMEKEEKNKLKSGKSLPDCLLFMMCEPKLSMEVSQETWISSTDFIRCLPERNPSKKANNKKTKAAAVAAQPPSLPPLGKPGVQVQPGRSSISFPANLKLAKAGVGFEPLVLTRCKSAPMRPMPKFTQPELGCNRQTIEPHKPATFGVGF